MWTIIEECLNPPVVWEKSRVTDGDVETGFFTLPPFAEPEVFDFPEGIGPVECVHVEHEEVLLMPRWVDAQRVTFKSGLGATNHFEAAAFVRSKAGVDYPDIQYHFLPVAIRYDGKAAAKAHGFQAHVGPMRSKSRGSVRLASGDPTTPPRIHFDYMSHPDDWAEFRAAIRLTRKIFVQSAFAL